MPTKSQVFRYNAERSAPKKKAKSPKRPRPKPAVDTALPGVSATDRRAGGDSTAARNLSKSAARKASYALEDSTLRPSRKSTRRSHNRQKTDSALRQRQTERAAAPSERSRRR